MKVSEFIDSRPNPGKFNVLSNQIKDLDIEDYSNLTDNQISLLEPENKIVAWLLVNFIRRRVEQRPCNPEDNDSDDEDNTPPTPESFIDKNTLDFSGRVCSERLVAFNETNESLSVVQAFAGVLEFDLSKIEIIDLCISRLLSSDLPHVFDFLVKFVEKYPTQKLRVDFSHNVAYNDDNSREYLGKIIELECVEFFDFSGNPFITPSSIEFFNSWTPDCPIARKLIWIGENFYDEKKANWWDYVKEEVRSIVYNAHKKFYGNRFSLID